MELDERELEIEAKNQRAVGKTKDNCRERESGKERWRCERGGEKDRVPESK